MAGFCHCHTNAIHISQWARDKRDNKFQMATTKRELRMNEPNEEKYKAAKCSHYARITSSLNIVCVVVFVTAKKNSVCVCASLFVLRVLCLVDRSILRMKTCRNSIFDPFFLCYCNASNKRIVTRKFYCSISLCRTLVGALVRLHLLTSTLTQFNKNNSNKINAQVPAHRARTNTVGPDGQKTGERETQKKQQTMEYQNMHKRHIVMM